MNPIESGRTIAGKYRLEECRARGGMGSVWQARHLLLDTPLAIKFIDPQFALCREARCRFEREAKTVALLRSIHVAQIHDYGVEEEVPYIVMELLHGEDLSATLNRDKRLPLPAAVNIVTQVCKVLRSAHAAGVIHRDLKPGNIFLVASDEDEEIVKVLDFGVAKMMATHLDAHADLTKSGILMGSPRYMSPEQARGVKTLDQRSDLWSLAVIAFRMITGELPFPGSEIGEVILSICTKLAPSPSSFVPDLPPELDRFFERAFASDLSKRFQTAEEMAHAFACAAGQEAPPISLMDPASTERAIASVPFSDRGRSDPTPLPPVEERVTAIERPPRAERTLRSSSIPPEVETTVASPTSRHGERTLALGVRIRWGAIGAGVASLLLGTLLLLSPVAPPAVLCQSGLPCWGPFAVRPPATALTQLAPLAAPLVQLPIPPPVDLAPVPPTFDAVPSSDADLAPSPAPLLTAPSASPRRSQPLPRTPRLPRDRSAKKVLGI